ncbi:MAG: MFS transporter [Myxococcota bacterium]
MSHVDAAPDLDPPLPRVLWVLSAVSFFADVSGEMVYPVLPLFLVGVLHTSKTELGGIEGAAVLLVAVMSAFSGIRSDRDGRRVPWIRAGYGLPVLGKAIIAGATGWGGVLAGRLLDRFGKGLRGAPRDALIASLVPASQRGRAFGIHRAFDTAGALVGALLAAALMWALTGTPTGDAASEAPPWVYRLMFLVASGLGLASFGLTWIVDEAPHEPLPPQPKERGNLGGLPRSYWAVLGMLLVFSLANSSDMFLLLRAEDLGISAWAVVLTYAVYNVIYAVSSYPAGWLSDRFGRWGIIALGWALYAFVYAGFAITPAAGVWPLMAVYGLYMALTDGVGKALLADQVPAGHRGSAMGLFSAANGVTTLVASLVAGIVWDRSGPEAVFALGAGFAALALCVLLLSRAVARAPLAQG